MVDLSRLETRKMPLSYGSERCRIVLNDSRYTEELVALRNDPRLNRFIHHDWLTPEKHDAWLCNQLDGRKDFNFAILVDGEFAGAIALYHISGGAAEYGRFIMKEGPVRAYAFVATLLVASFGFEIIGLDLIYGQALEGNKHIHKHLAKNGYRRDPRYDQDIEFDGEKTKLLGFSLSYDEWPAVFAANRNTLMMLHLGLSN